MLKPGMIERFRKALPVIQELVKDLEWIESEFSFKNTTEEERSYVQHLFRIAGNDFLSAGWRLEEMFLPDVLYQGRLYKNKSDRYQIEGTNMYFTSGNGCEVYLPYSDWEDEEDENKFMTWVPTAIEFTHKENRYYFTARPQVILDGVLVRVRGRK